MFKFLFGFLKKKEQNSTFWGHLDVLRKYLFRSVIAIFVFAIIAFLYKDFIFNTIILLPSDTKFITYRAFCKIGTLLNFDGLCFRPFKLNLINTELGGQFRYHLMISAITGIIAAFPFIAWQLWLFIKPALKEKELKSSKGIILYISSLFFIGVLFGYFLVAPLTINFLATYELSSNINNLISISSYISILTILTLSMGIVFELPVLIYFLTKIDLLSSSFLRKYRKHAIVVIAILAAFITPSGDMFSMLLVGFPIWGLFEISIFVSKKVEKNRKVI
ncbi:MAG: twin-arginine translocase subunit TatC [Bacteroidetes bacterium CG_4_10_14_3_um_filter_31_20]|nr:twin-arginine translocase subunit TatC [Bacteroidota bacterium]PIY03261.1 MAG: twin-arginine translocase subunit TatC [Bacteroidetes bacterium CG_4_10_14_3_um_filter_31_20]